MVTAKRTDAEALEKTRGCDALFDRINHCDAAHYAYAAITEGAKSTAEVFSQAPGFATIEEGASDLSIVDPA